MLVDTQNLSDLPIATKLELMEAVNQSLANDETFEPPAWHETVLKSREDELKNPEGWLSVDELKKSMTP